MSNYLSILKNEIQNLLPGNFALVMATGIVSLAADHLGFTEIGIALFYLNIFNFSLLALFTILRIIFFTKNIREDFFNNAKSTGFLTMVAGTNILGNQFALIAKNFEVASILFYVGLTLWVFFIYAFFIMTVIKKDKPTLEQGINGIWLLMVVATQSCSILGVLVVDHLVFDKELVLFNSLVLFLAGCMLYIIIITLIFYRLTFFNLKADDFTPPYWINMGAVAITTLAGATLLLNVHQWDFLASLVPFIEGFTLLFWAIGTWWIPIVVLLGLWRHWIGKVPVNYNTQYWAMVFPLGMYTVCTYKLSKAIDVEFLMNIPQWFVYLAMITWTLTFFGLLKRLFKLFNKSAIIQ